MKLESMNAEATWYEGNAEQLVLEDLRSLEFLELIDTSSVLMDVALGKSVSLVEPMESSR